MIHPSMNAFKASLARGGPGKGPFAIVIAEDKTEVLSTLHHLLHLGFRKLFLLAQADLEPPEIEAPECLELVRAQTRDPKIAEDAVNALIAAAPGEWIHYCYNAEYLFYPFCEQRRVGEMLGFVMEERRESVLTYVVDLYAGDLTDYPNAVSLETAHLDRSGYYAARRRDGDDQILERQLNFFGGLRWRFEEHIPETKRRIDRIGLFQAKPGLKLLPGHMLSDPELNTYSCPWHHSLTAAVCSFRAAKALRANPGSRHDIHSYRWDKSSRFYWSSRQLMDLGLMEPGQWF